jgi:hypothetical protein
MSQRLLKRIVHNDAMDTDPPEIYGWRVYLLACSVILTSMDSEMLVADHVKACFGAMSFGWDSSVIGGVIVLPPFKRYVPDACKERA